MSGTHEKPIAALPVRISLIESNVFQSFSYSYDGLVQGNGAGSLKKL